MSTNHLADTGDRSSSSDSASPYFPSDSEGEGLTVPTSPNGETVPELRAKPRQRKPRAPKQLPLPRQTAKVKDLAEQQAGAAGETNIDAPILERIKKCLDRANHPNTPEMEAKAALRMSSRLMAQYNVSQADILALASTSEEQAALGGASTVAITSTKSVVAKVIMQSWVRDLINAMKIFFDCKAYSTAYGYKIVWTFYGIPQNTVAAAISFEMAHNLTLEWAREKKGAINSYCMGVAAGLKEMAREEKRNEKRQARKREQEALAAKVEQERLQRQRELDRLNRLAPEADEEDLRSAQVEEEMVKQEPIDYDENSADESGSPPAAFGDVVLDDFDSDECKPTFKQENELPLDLSADFEEELQKIIKQERSPTPELANVQDKTKPKIEAKEEEPTPPIQNPGPSDDQPAEELSLWTSPQQIILFRKSAMKVAEEYLKSTKRKLHKSRKRTCSVRDYGAFEAGKRDSRNIDVRRRRLE